MMEFERRTKYPCPYDERHASDINLFSKRGSELQKRLRGKGLLIEKLTKAKLEVRMCCGTCIHWYEEGETETGWCNRLSILTWIGTDECNLENYDYYRDIEELKKQATNI